MTEMQRRYTDKNISRILLKAAGNISDNLAVRDKDYMDYAATLNAHDSNSWKTLVLSKLPWESTELRT